MAVGVETYSVCADGDALIFVRLYSPDGSFTDIEKTTEVGDILDVTITRERDALKVKAVNVTQGWDATVSGPRLNDLDYVIGQVTVLLDGEPIPLPDFGKAEYTDVAVDGVDLKDTDPTKYDCVDEDSQTRMATSKIKNGNDFAVRFKHA